MTTTLVSDSNDVEPGHATAPDRALCVDLDGTLVKVDTLYDSLLVMARQKPGTLLQVPRWTVGGKANLKRNITAQISLDVAHLPFNRPLVDYLRHEHGLGRSIYLATGADMALAERIAQQMPIFKGVLASDGSTNLTGTSKLAGMRERFGSSGFDYIGNARPDLPLLEHATEPMVANPNAGLLSELRSRKIKPVRSFIDRLPLSKSLPKAIRIHQWAKNVLIFLPFLLAHKFHLISVITAVLAFLSFSFCASATYIVNDLLDLESDRMHPKKRLRPFAAGDISVLGGVGIITMLLALTAACLLALPKAFALWLGFYVVATLSYTLALKRMPLFDVLMLSGLYTVRILAGGAATGTVISQWLAAFSIFLFFSLGIVKRFSELENLRQRGASPTNGRGYLVSDLEQLRAFGTASAFAAVVVFTLYISRPEVAILYSHQSRLWLVEPLMILWLCRVWLLTSRGEMNEDPVIFALRDRTSLAIGMAIAAVALFSL